MAICIVLKPSSLNIAQKVPLVPHKTAENIANINPIPFFLGTLISKDLFSPRLFHQVIIIAITGTIYLVG